TALFGPSGAGKTMTLRMIAGLTKPDRGTIEVSGRTLFDAGAGIDLPPRERRVGYLFQQYALFPHLSVERNVGYALARMSREERGADPGAAGDGRRRRLRAAPAAAALRWPAAAGGPRAGPRRRTVGPASRRALRGGGLPRSPATAVRTARHAEPDGDAHGAGD